MITERLTIRLFLTIFQLCFEQAVLCLEFDELKGNMNVNTHEYSLTLAPSTVHMVNDLWAWPTVLALGESSLLSWFYHKQCFMSNFKVLQAS